MIATRSTGVARGRWHRAGLVLLCLAPLIAVAQESVPNPAASVATALPVAWPVWAARMEKAQQLLNYDATLVIDHGRDWELVEVTQRIGSTGAEQQVVALNGESRRYVRTAQGISLLGPEGDTRLSQAPTAPGSMEVNRVGAAYKVTLGARDRVAGRSAIRLNIAPMSNDRYGLKLWLDADTGLPLRSERLAADGSVLERRMVTRLNVLGFAGAAQLAPRAAVDAPADLVLPAGFALIGPPIPVPGVAGGQQWILSDGLAWVSVYRLPITPGTTSEARGWRRGAMGQVAINANNAWIYVLGDLPSPTLERLGEAVLASQH